MKMFKAEYYRAVGSSERVRIYKHTRRRVGQWMPVFISTRTLWKAGVYARDVEKLLEKLNQGSRFGEVRLYAEDEEDSYATG